MKQQQQEQQQQQQHNTKVMCDNEAFEFCEVLSPRVRAADNVAIEILPTDTPRFLNVKASAARSQSIQRSNSAASSSKAAANVQTENCGSDSGKNRNSVSAGPTRTSAPSEDADNVHDVNGGRQWLPWPLASAFTRSAAQRLSSLSRNPSPYSQDVDAEAEVFSESPEPVPYRPNAEDPAVEDFKRLMLSLEQLHNLLAERRSAVGIVDCRQDSQTSRCDLSHLLAFHYNDLLEAEGQQLQRLNRNFRYLVLACTDVGVDAGDADAGDLAADAGIQRLLLLRHELLQHVAVSCNSSSAQVLILACDISFAAYLGDSSQPAPLVFEEAVYLMPLPQFQFAAESLYSGVVTDSRQVEKFCQFQATPPISCCRIRCLNSDAAAALLLMRRVEQQQDQCVLLCFADVQIGKALAVAYVMWKRKHLLKDATARLRHAYAVLEFDEHVTMQLLHFERKLFCHGLSG